MTIKIYPVLVVEDVAQTAEIVRAGLVTLGCDVTIAVDGGNAVACASEREFKLIFMDLRMPVMDGFEASRRIRDANTASLNIHTPIVALSGEVSRENVHECLDAGMNDYLPKPVGPDQLLQKLVKWKVLPQEPHSSNAAADVTPPTLARDPTSVTFLAKSVSSEQFSTILSLTQESIREQIRRLNSPDTDILEMRKAFHDLISMLGYLGLAELSQMSRTLATRLAQGGSIEDGEISSFVQAADEGLEWLSEFNHPAPQGDDR
jgi:CheY-like chemotaxis protein